MLSADELEKKCAEGVWQYIAITPDEIIYRTSLSSLPLFLPQGPADEQQTYVDSSPQ